MPDQKGPYRNRYVIRMEHPLIREGISIQTEADARHVPDVVDELTDLGQRINEIDRSRLPDVGG